MVLQNNGAEELEISANGDFTFTTPLADEAAYSVTVLNQPDTPDLNCQVSNGSGTVPGEDVTDILVRCAVELVFESGFENP